MDSLGTQLQQVNESILSESIGGTTVLGYCTVIRGTAQLVSLKVVSSLEWYHWMEKLCTVCKRRTMIYGTTVSVCMHQQGCAAVQPT